MCVSGVRVEGQEGHMAQASHLDFQHYLPKRINLRAQRHANKIESRMCLSYGQIYVSLLDYTAYDVPEINIFDLFYYMMNSMTISHDNIFSVYSVHMLNI